PRPGCWRITSRFRTKWLPSSRITESSSPRRTQRRAQESENRVLENYARTGSPSARAGFRALTELNNRRSPRLPWLVPSACHTAQAIVLLTKHVLPSHRTTLTPPGCRLRAAKAFQFGVGWALQSAFKGF